MVLSESKSELLVLALAIFVEDNLLDMDLLDEDWDFCDPLLEDGVPDLDLELALLDLELSLDTSSSCSRLRV
jgi:hypothetical protein